MRAVRAKHARFERRSKVNGSADVLAFSGLRIASEVDADHPHLGSAADNLAGFFEPYCLLKETKRRTCGTRSRCKRWFYQLIIERGTDGGSVARVGTEM